MTRDPPVPDEPEHMEGATKALSQDNGKHRTRSDAYLQATRLTALVAVAAFTVAVGSAGATSPLSGPKISDPNTGAFTRSTEAGPTTPPASLFRDPGIFTSRSQERPGLAPQDTVDVPATSPVSGGPDSPNTWQRREDVREDAAAAAAEAAQAAKARAALKRPGIPSPPRLPKPARDAEKARAVAARIEAVEAVMDAKRATARLVQSHQPWTIQRRHRCGQGVGDRGADPYGV